MAIHIHNHHTQGRVSPSFVSDRCVVSPARTPSRVRKTPSSKFRSLRNNCICRGSILVPRWHLMACHKEEDRRTCPVEGLAVCYYSLADIPDSEAEPLFLRSRRRKTVRYPNVYNCLLLKNLHYTTCPQGRAVADR